MNSVSGVLRLARARWSRQPAPRAPRSGRRVPGRADPSSSGTGRACTPRSRATSSSSCGRRDVVLVRELLHHRRARAREVHLRQASGARCRPGSSSTSSSASSSRPVMCTSFFTSGNRPQNVKNTVVSMPIAAPVVARINVRPDACPGRRSTRRSRACCVWRSRARAQRARPASSRASRRQLAHGLVVMVLTPSSDHEAVDPVVLGLLDELVARSSSHHAVKSGTEPGSVASDLDQLTGLQRRGSPARSSRSAAGRTALAGPASATIVCAHRATSFGIVTGRVLGDPALRHGLPVQAVEDPLRRRATHGWAAAAPAGARSRTAARSPCRSPSRGSTSRGRRSSSSVRCRWTSDAIRLAITGASKCAVDPRLRDRQVRGVAEREDPLVPADLQRVPVGRAATRRRRRGRSRSRPAGPGAAARARAGRTRRFSPSSDSTMSAPTDRRPPR